MFAVLALAVVVGAKQAPSAALLDPIHVASRESGCMAY